MRLRGFLAKARNRLLGVGALERQNLALQSGLAGLHADVSALASRQADAAATLEATLEAARSRLADNSDTLVNVAANAQRARDALETFGGRIERAIAATYLSTSDQTRFLAFVRQFTPWEANEKKKIRVGRTGDGGYVMVDAFEGVATAFSCGVGDEASWDLDMAARGVRVHQFDHTIATGPVVHPSIVYHSKQVSHEGGPARVTLQEMLALSTPDATRGPVLKMDIEHDEWKVLAEAEAETLAGFSQIVVEFHTIWRVYDNDWLSTAEATMNNLKQNFEVVHVHANNAASFVNIANIIFPELIEVTFLNRSLASFSKSTEIFPTKLDSPNEPGIADLHLGSFHY